MNYLPMIWSFSSQCSNSCKDFFITDSVSVFRVINLIVRFIATITIYGKSTANSVRSCQVALQNEKYLSDRTILKFPHCVVDVVFTWT